MTSLQHLLPGPDEAVRCADHSRGLQIDPAGTAIGCDRVILIETPLPWPKPVFDHPNLVAVAPVLKASTVPTRTLAFVPAASSGDDGHAPTDTVITFDRIPATGPTESPTVMERRFRPSSPEEWESLARALATDEVDTLTTMATYRSDVVAPVVLICTQGSHDVCCGSEGARFAAEAETIDQLRVFRVSHTGGHRFAPTAMTLPDGRMWADMDTDMLRSILWRTGDAADLVANCRGWWGAAPGPAQVAERAVFEHLGWESEDRDRTVTQDDTTGGVTRCVVRSGERAWEVTVAVGRAVPTIACRQPGGLPSKQSREYAVSSIAEI
jgi:hypothetical protein